MIDIGRADKAECVILNRHPGRRFRCAEYTIALIGVDDLYPMPDQYPSSPDFSRRTFARASLTIAFTSLTSCDNTKRLNAIPGLFWCDQERMDALAARLGLGDRQRGPRK